MRDPSEMNRQNYNMDVSVTQQILDNMPSDQKILDEVKSGKLVLNTRGLTSD